MNFDWGVFLFSIVIAFILLWLWERGNIKRKSNGKVNSIKINPPLPQPAAVAEVIDDEEMAQKFEKLTMERDRLNLELDGIQYQKSKFWTEFRIKHKAIAAIRYNDVTKKFEILSNN